MKHLFYFIIITLLLPSACSQEHISSKFDKFGIAGTILVNSDTTFVLIKDFFPAEDNIISCSAKGYTIRYNPGSDTILLINTDSTKIASLLEINTRGEKASIIVQNRMKFKYNTPQPFLYTLYSSEDTITVQSTKLFTSYIVLWQNSNISKFVKYEVSDSIRLLKIKIPYCAGDFERSYIRVYAASDSAVSNDILIPLKNGKVITDFNNLTRKDRFNQIMYSLMIDRFCDGDSLNTKKLNSPEVLPKVDYFGGDMAGVLLKIKSGFFNELGINTIWLSPVIQNPFDAWGQIEDPKTKFSGYHGYWPYFITKIDSRFGNDKILEDIIKEAHSRNINILLDYVSNHMFINSPTLKAHPDWVTSNITPDGRPNFQLWDEFRLTTWFDKHIPSLDLGKKYVYEPMTDSALIWLQKFDIDGFRHDATKHVPDVYWRTLTQKIVKKYPKRTFFQIGETYGSSELISSYVKKGMLDAQFDFNIYDSFIYSVIDKEGSFINLATTINNSMRTYGFHNLMGLISGNQDRPRFISLAGGALNKDEDSKLAGWKRNIGVGNEIGYERVSMLNALIMTLPGVPCIYYGDEYGQPGANDPDNRRWMKFDGYSKKEKQLRDELVKLIKLRKMKLPLIFGDFYELFSDRDAFAYCRMYMGEIIISAFNKSSEEINLRLLLPVNLSKDSLTAYKGKIISSNANMLEIKVQKNSFSIIQANY